MIAMPVPKKCPACGSSRLKSASANGAVKMRCERCGFESERREP